jgi:O-antigen biosynthesis protein
MKVAFLVPGLGMSGGSYVVYQHALFAMTVGHDVTVAVVERFSVADKGWHPAMDHIRFAHLEDIATEAFDIAYATHWSTVLYLHRLDSRQYAYFVQSIESRFFHPTQVRMRALVDRTYALRLPGVTEATWIRDYLQQYHQSSYHLVRNGIRKDLYLPTGEMRAPRGACKLRVLVEGAFGDGGLVKNTARAVRIGRRARPDELWLLTSSHVSWFPGTQRVFSRLPITEVAAVYRSCDVLLKLSLVEGMFGPPLEMFHCGGTAIVYDVSGHDEYISHNENALVASMHDEGAVVEYLRRLSQDRDLLQRLKKGALETAATWPDWDESSRLFVESMDALRDSEPVLRDRLVSEIEKIMVEFAHELNVSTGVVRRGHFAGLAASAARRICNSVYPSDSLLRYIAEGYRQQPSAK